MPTTKKRRCVQKLRSALGPIPIDLNLPAKRLAERAETQAEEQQVQRHRGSALGVDNQLASLSSKRKIESSTLSWYAVKTQARRCVNQL
eukprot:3879199-Pleurochrysis_carterae.AAC.1